MHFSFTLGLAAALTIFSVTQVKSQAFKDGDNGLKLKADAVQAASKSDGQEGGKGNTGEAASATSSENFINFCSGKKLTNGLQIETGSCNGIPMGEIPAKTNMVSSIITFPTTGGDPIKANQDFDIKLKVNNLIAGAFTNPQNTYYSAPQQLQNGIIVGHVHVTVQDMGNTFNPTNAMNAAQFAFFKGINDKAGEDGSLTATVTGGLPAGIYRACTLTSAANHQAVTMPVAQRGAQDDCTKFEVSNNGTKGNTSNNAKDSSKNKANKKNDDDKKRDLHDYRKNKRDYDSHSRSRKIFTRVFVS